MLNQLGDVTRRARELEAILGGSTYFDAIGVAARQAQQVQEVIEALHLDEVARAAQQIRSTQAELWARQQAKLMEDVAESERHIQEIIVGTRIMEQMESMRLQLASEARHATEVARRFVEQLIGPPDQHLRIREALLPQVSVSALNAVIGAFPADGYLGDLLGQGSMAAAINSLRSAIEAPSLESISKAIDLMGEDVEEAIESKPANWQFRVSVLMLIVQILQFLLDAYTAFVQPQVASAKAAEFEAKMMEQFRMLNERLDDSDDGQRDHSGFDFYRVERRAPLVQKPRAKERALAWIEPGALLSVLEDRGTWVQVDFPEARPGTPREGWIRRKYLAR